MSRTTAGDIPVSRRSLLAGSVAALGSGLVETVRGGESAAASPVCEFTTPSNAAVTGVDPDEWVLFSFDDHWIPLRSGLALTMLEPQLHPENPVLRRGGPGTPDCFFAAMYGTVLRLDGKFRMWYSGVDSWEDFEPGRGNLRLAYAESADGIRWEKPELDLVTYKGSRKNNLLGLERDCYNPVVLYEPHESDPDRRFKMVYTGYHHKGIGQVPLLCVAYSADGLRWKDYEKNPAVRKIWTEISGCYRWNGIYYANGQSGYPPANPKRSMVSFASPDLTTWEEAGIISFHRPEKQPQFHVGRQVHLGAAVWHRRNVLLGLYGAWEGPPTNRRPDVRMNLGLVLSNDGMLFREPMADFPFLRWGAEPSGWKTLRLLQGSAFVNHEDKTYIWYGAGVGEHEAIENLCEVGLATLPRDRFAHLAPQKPGSFWTSQTLPPMPGGARLAVNADGLGPQARLEIDIVDHGFRPLGARADRPAGVVAQSGLREPVTWATGAAPAKLDAPWRLRVRFEGDAAANARFYCMYVKPEHT